MKHIATALAAAALIALPLAASASDVSTWTSSASGNSAAAPNGFPENMLPSQVNDAARETMAAIRRWYNRVNAAGTVGGTANAITLAYSPVVTAYVTGDGYTFFASATNTGAATLNVSGLGAKSIKLGSNSLTGGEIVAGQAVMVFYDGTAFQLLSGGGSVVIGPGNLALNGGGCLALNGGGCLALNP